MEVNVYTDSTIKNPKRGEGTAMFLIECPQKPDNVVKGFVHLPDTTEDAITLTAIIEALQRFTRPTTIKIFTKSNIYHAIYTGRIFEAKDDGYLTKKAQPVKNAELWDIFFKLVPKHSWSVTQEDHSFMELMRSELKKWPKV